MLHLLGLHWKPHQESAPEGQRLRSRFSSVDFVWCHSDDCFFHRFNVMHIFPDCSAIMHLESSCSTNALFIFQGCFTHCLFQRVKAWAKALLHIEAFQLGLLHGLHPQSVFFLFKHISHLPQKHLGLPRGLTSSSRRVTSSIPLSLKDTVAEVC